MEKIIYETVYVYIGRESVLQWKEEQGYPDSPKS